MRVLLLFLLFASTASAQLTLIGKGAQGQKELIIDELAKALEKADKPLDEYSSLISRIAVRRYLTPQQCNNRWPRGCTLMGRNKEGKKIALVWYMPGQDVRKILAHEFQHAIGWVDGSDDWDFHPRRGH